MTIQILPARLANQIAAGEVVERPASVIKELVENSLDAGATRIHIDVEKGGAKTIRISDDGCGIDKDELSLALSRHATSKIKDLADLEAIASLGFRGEALASISSVARLTLTSKPQAQENAWQAFAQGRDMEVTIKPAAHPNGTTIEVNDLFFNTPARRKFLRTEKTEFNHIDEVIRRIALARFDVTFVLTHNGKMIRQYRAVNHKSQYVKRVATVCGQKFVDNSIEVECQHDNLHLWGWIAKPSYVRPTNDLSYSYVNGRMMRDKLINHAIRQAFAELIPSDGFPAFVLFLSLDHKDVDVNVHPAKHEVRFHQSRYVHDFIYSVCHQALEQSMQQELNEEDVCTEFNDNKASLTQGFEEQSKAQTERDFNASVTQQLTPAYTGTLQQQNRDYIKPLQQMREPGSHYQHRQVDHVQASSTYQQLMTPYQTSKSSVETKENIDYSGRARQKNSVQVVHITEGKYALVSLESELRLVSLTAFATEVSLKAMIQRWQQGIVSQPLLLPVVMAIEENQKGVLDNFTVLFQKAGIVFSLPSATKVQIRQFPACLRDKDINTSFSELLRILTQSKESLTENDMINALVAVSNTEEYTLDSAKMLMSNAKTQLDNQFNECLYLNSVLVDLTSEITQLN